MIQVIIDGELGTRNKKHTYRVKLFGVTVLMFSVIDNRGYPMKLFSASEKKEMNRVLKTEKDKWIEALEKLPNKNEELIERLNKM